MCFGLELHKQQVVGGNWKRMKIIEIHCVAHEWITTSNNKQLRGFNGREYVDMTAYMILQISTCEFICCFSGFVIRTRLGVILLIFRIYWTQSKSLMSSFMEF